MWRWRRRTSPRRELAHRWTVADYTRQYRRATQDERLLQGFLHEGNFRDRTISAVPARRQ
jgi:hypothetical protein